MSEQALIERPLYYEAKIAEKLSLSREDVRYLRDELLEQKNGDWAQRGRDIVLSKAGVTAILKHLNVDPEADYGDCLVQKNDPLEFTVKKIFPNVRLVQAIAPAANGEPERLVTVRVTDNSNFKPKMPIKVIAPPAGATGVAALYKLAGRCPRYPGRY